MEKLEKKEQPIKSHSIKNLLYGVGISILSVFGGTSCNKPTGVDVVEQKEDMIALVEQIDLLREERAIAVEEFNKMIDKEGTPGYDNIQYENAKVQQYDRIVDMEKDLNKKIKKYNKKAKRLTKTQLKMLKKHKPNSKSKMDEHEYDFTKTFSKKPK